MLTFSSKWKSHLIDIVIVTLIGTVISLFYIWDKFTIVSLLENMLYSMIIGTFLWKGNELIGTIFFNKFGTKLKISIYILFNSIAIIIWTSFAILLVNYLWSLFYFSCFSNFLDMHGLSIMIIQFIVSIIITLILITRSFYTDLLEAFKREEKLKQERLAMEYQVLKNQVNPHFLFNSLNTLASLVEVDTKQSVRFIKQLSDVYRYVLDQHQAETVELSKELAFTRSYLELQKIRMQESLNYSIDVVNEKFEVLPLSIQMLVENCIKHNKATVKYPLKISIIQDENLLIVRNNIQKKSDNTDLNKFSDSINLGLKNLESRFSFLTETKMSIEETTEEFIVKIPLLKPEFYD